MGFFYEIYQTGRIAESEQRAASAASASSAADLVAHVQELERRLDRLTLVSQALVSLLEQKAGVTEAALLLRMQELSTQRLNLELLTVTCARCGHTAAPRIGKCIYCGRSHGDKSPFDRT